MLSKGVTKSMPPLYVAILAGGKGERLWPMSRRNLPKQNLRLFGRRTIMQNTLIRARKLSSGNIFVITSKENSSHVKEQFKKLRNENIIVEPFSRNTAPAIGLAALLAFRKNRESILVTMPSDHLIINDKKFFETMSIAIKEAEMGDAVVTIGIKPISPESGYGYMGVDARLKKISLKKSYKIVKFVEKPNPATAKRLISDGRFFWNSGIFIFKASKMMSMLKEYMPTFYKGLVALPGIKDKESFNSRLKRLYKNVKNESLDYAILEKSKDIRVVPSSFIWKDIGSFNSIASLLKRDSNGNIIIGNNIGIRTKNCFVYSDKSCLIGTMGVKDLIVVATEDSVLVCDRKKAEDIKKLVEKIKRRKSFLKFL